MKNIYSYDYLLDADRQNSCNLRNIPISTILFLQEIEDKQQEQLDNLFRTKQSFLDKLKSFLKR